MYREYLTRKESILLTAIHIMDDIGIHDLSTREIAKRQNVSDSSLYRHFKSKDDIIREVLNYYSRYDRSIFRTVEHMKYDPLTSIRFFFHCIFEYYQNYPAITSVIHSFSYYKRDRSLEEAFAGIFQLRKETIGRYLQLGIDEKRFKPDTPVEDVASLLVGQIISCTLLWRLGRYSYPIKDKALAAIDRILDSVTDNAASAKSIPYATEEMP